MDGVIVDSLGLDLGLVNELLEPYTGKKDLLAREYIRSIFPRTIPDFWNLIFAEVANRGIKVSDNVKKDVFEAYMEARRTVALKAVVGIPEQISASQKMGFKNAVVSNSPIEQVRAILERIGVLGMFELVIGIDTLPSFNGKPEPDTYEYAMKQLGVMPDESVVVEDSFIGGEAGKRAGCYVIGVSTGALTKEQLLSAPQFFDAVI